MMELYSDEKIILKKRRFWLPIVIEGVSFLLFGGAPLIVLMLIEGSFAPEVQELISQYSNLFWFGAFAWAFIFWNSFFIVWTNYYLDILLITTKRVIDVEQLGLFARDLAEMRIESIQDIKVQVIGILASLLDFGNIHIQTAGVNREFIIEHIQNPHQVKDAIMKQREALSANH